MPSPVNDLLMSPVYWNHCIECKHTCWYKRFKPL